MHDCLIVGMGPAGLAAAYHLARRGRRVIAVDRTVPGRYKPCGGGISPAVAAWFEFDFAPVVSHKIATVRYTWQLGTPVEAQLEVAEPMWMVQRGEFDEFLAARAREAGAELQSGVTATGLVKGDRDAVTLQTSTGNLQARYAVIADGATGSGAKWAGFKERQRFLSAVLEIPTDEAPAANAHFEFGLLKNGFLWSFPKQGSYAISGGVFRANKGKTTEITEKLHEFATSLGLDSARGTLYEHPMCLWHDAKPLHRERVLLAGDAAGLADPLVVEGIRPALLSGVRAAEAIDRALTENAPKALTTYSDRLQAEWGNNMKLARDLSGWFYRFPGTIYKVALTRPRAAAIMSRILCGELSYSDVTEEVVGRLKQKFLPGGRG